MADTLVQYFDSNGRIQRAFADLSAAGLSQVAGETGTGTQQVSANAMSQFMIAVTDPLIEGRGIAVTPSPALGYAGSRPPSEAMAAMDRKMPVIVGHSLQRWSVWATAYGGAQLTSGNAAAGSSTATSRLYGAIVGADYHLSPTTLAGFAMAGGGTNFVVANSGGGRSDLFQAGGFIRHSIGASYITAALAYGWQDVITDRRVGSDSLRARFSSNMLSGRAELGHRFATPLAGLTPYVAGQVTTTFLPSYAEQAVSGPGLFGLAYTGRDLTAVRSELGLRLDRALAIGDGVMTLRGRAAWAHNINTERSLSASFQALPGTSFTVNGAAQAPDAALVSASAEFAWRTNWSIAASFEGEFSHVTTSFIGKGTVRYAW